MKINAVSGSIKITTVALTSPNPRSPPQTITPPKNIKTKIAPKQAPPWINTYPYVLQNPRGTHCAQIVPRQTPFFSLYARTTTSTTDITTCAYSHPLLLLLPIRAMFWYAANVHTKQMPTYTLSDQSLKIRVLEDCLLGDGVPPVPGPVVVVKGVPPPGPFLLGDRGRRDNNCIRGEAGGHKRRCEGCRAGEAHGLIVDGPDG